MQTASNVGLICGLVGAALAAGIEVSARVYQPTSASLLIFHAISKVAALVAGVGATVVLVAYLATGKGPG